MDEQGNIISEIEARTFDYGGEWGVNHAKRLIAIAERIVEREEYDRELYRLSAYLHDWGGYDPWKKPDTDHATRSAELIPDVLRDLGALETVIAGVSECARLHHHCDQTASFEAILLHDADAIDLVGITGLLRNFSMMPRDLRRAFDKTKERVDYASGHLILSRSRSLVRPLLARTEELLEEFQQETGGLF